MSDDWYIDLSKPPKDSDPLPNKTDDPKILKKLQELELRYLKRVSAYKQLGDSHAETKEEEGSET